MRKINVSFLAGCTGLTLLNLSPLTNVTEVKGLLEGSPGVMKVKAPPLCVASPPNEWVVVEDNHWLRASPVVEGSLSSSTVWTRGKSVVGVCSA